MQMPQTVGPRSRFHWHAAALIVALTTFAASRPASAHDFKAGSVVIEHPYATPTPPGARTGAVYFRALRNEGKVPDKLIGARTPAAGSVEIHRAGIDGQGVMRMRELEALELPPGAAPNLRHGGELHLMLVDLKAPLKVGDRFPVVLKFEKGGETEVNVWVQQPKERAAEGHRH